MKYVFYIISIVLIIINEAVARNIQYGYNARGEYVPIQIDGEMVQYGYNPRGEYVPTSIGDNHIGYGYNPRGDYVPTYIDEKW